MHTNDFIIIIFDAIECYAKDVIRGNINFRRLNLNKDLSLQVLATLTEIKLFAEVNAFASFQVENLVFSQVDKKFCIFVNLRKIVLFLLLIKPQTTPRKF